MESVKRSQEEISVEGLYGEVPMHNPEEDTR